MAYSTVASLKVLIFLLGVTQGIYPNRPKEPNLSMVANILQNLFKAYTNSLRESQKFVIVTDKPPQIEPHVEKVINRKVKELKPFLQDQENIIQAGNYIRDDINKELNREVTNEDNNITLMGDEETTIIEFHPETDSQKPIIRLKDPKPSEFKDNILKYKKLRDKIKSALIEESVSFKTQKLITHTLDDMLAIMVRSQCPANSNLDDTLYNSLRSKTVERTTKDLAKNWTEQWHAIKDKYRRIWKEHFSKQPNPARKLFMFFEQIQEFLTTIEKDTEHISNNYRVVCKLVKKDNTMDEIDINNFNLVNFRTGEERKKYNCPTFKICSDELRQFLGRFYHNLNDTAVSTFRNYAAMYKSDVNSDGSGEKESVIASINKIGDATEQKISKIFRKTAETLVIDRDKDKNENIKLLRYFVSDTIDTCLDAIKSSINGEIVFLRARIIDNLKQDLKANIKVDLENVGAELNDGICRYFSSCNSHIMRRSFDDVDNEIKARAHKPADTNKVYVKLQMNFDKKLKEDLARGNVDFLDYAFFPIKNASREHSFKFSPINVTRTKQPDTTTQAVIPENNSKKENFERIPNKEKFHTALKKKILEKNSETESGKYSKTDNSESNSETREMRSTRLIPHETSAEILE